MSTRHKRHVHVFENDEDPGSPPASPDDTHGIVKHFRRKANAYCGAKLRGDYSDEVGHGARGKYKPHEMISCPDCWKAMHCFICAAQSE